jgi:hypothetical protein
MLIRLPSGGPPRGGRRRYYLLPLLLLLLLLLSGMAIFNTRSGTQGAAVQQATDFQREKSQL